MTASSVKNFKKGEVLFNEGESIEHLLFINSGKVKTFLSRNKTAIELHQYSGTCVFGETGITTTSKFLYSAMAMSDVTALIIPIEGMKTLIENTPQLEKALFKSLIEQSKILFTAVKNFKIASDTSPCPEELIPRLFGGIFYFILHIGTKIPQEGASPTTLKVKCSWSQLKQYCFRIFSLPLDKVENACNILCKLGFAEFIYESNEDEPELGPQLTQLIFNDFYKIEQFFEFYQYYYFRSGKGEMLKVDENIHQIVRGILDFSQKEEVDRKGVIRVPLNILLETIKAKLNISITSTHWTLFDQRGLFSKRSQVDNVFYFSFNLEEFQRFYNSSRFLREIHKWNDTGSVNPKDLENPIPQQQQQIANVGGATVKCPKCQAIVSAQQKFCGECGAKL